MTLSWHRTTSRQQQKRPNLPIETKTQQQHDTMIEEQKQCSGETQCTTASLSLSSSPSKTNDHFVRNGNSHGSTSKRLLFSSFCCYHDFFHCMISKMLNVLLFISIGVILCMVSNRTSNLGMTLTTATTLTKVTKENIINHTTETTGRNDKEQQLRGTVNNIEVALQSDIIQPSMNFNDTVMPISKSSAKIRQISVLGERNSGTRWTFDHISECFNHSIDIHRRLTRYKHWFQYDNSSEYLHNTLVLTQFRNPYEWLKAMEHVPHHSPAHLRTALRPDSDDTTKNQTKSSLNDWKVFLTKPWTTARVGLDVEMTHDNYTLCQEHFYYRDIVSCHIQPLPSTYYNWTLRFSENEPFYEMRNDGSGLPYDNIMEMRTDKIRNFLSVKTYKGIADVWTIQYEYLLYNGTRHLLDRIAQYTGIPYHCEPKEPQPERKPKPSRLLTQEMAHYVRTHLNWTVEEMIGYYPELKREKPFPEW